MASPYTIRPVDGGDDFITSLLRDLHDEIFVGTAPTPDFDAGQWWIVTSPTDIVGFCGITPSTYMPMTGYLKRAGVKQGHRGHGLQRRMVSVRERYARRQGWMRLYTDTATFNLRSSNNLFKAGFELFRPNPLWAGEDFLYWRKRCA